MPDAPIFILGTERSGSNLLRLLLDAHPRIAVPHPPHIVRYFEPLEPLYGDLGADGPFRAMVSDVLRLVHTHIYAWDVPLDAERIVREASPRNAFGVYVASYEQYREHAGKARWACKSTFMVHHVEAIRARFPDARLVLLVRDPRDVAASSKQSVFSTFHPLHTAELWRADQAEGLRWLDALPSTTIHLLHYERLVGDPDGEVRRLCAFLGEPFEPAMLRFFERDEARKSAGLAESWANTGRPVSTASRERWRRELTVRQRLLVEWTAHREMLRLGYTPVATESELAAVRISPAERARIAAEDRLLEAHVELRSLRKDANVWRRWRRAWTLATIRARRRLHAP